MPRFSPSLEQGLGLSISRLVDSAYGIRKVDEARLTDRSRVLLGSFRALAASGMRHRDLIAEMSVSGAGADEEHERRLFEFFHSKKLEDVRVLCVTTEADCPRMWEVYAEGATGVTVELKHVPEHSSSLLAARKVAYAAEPPVIGSAEDFLLYGEDDRLLQASLSAVVYTKHADWSYQSEWRAVLFLRTPEASLFSDYAFLPAELSAVRFGKNASTGFRAEIRELVESTYPDCLVGD